MGVIVPVGAWRTLCGHFHHMFGLTAARGVSRRVPVGVFIVGALAGCAGSSQAPDVQPSGLWSASVTPVRQSAPQDWAVSSRRAPSGPAKRASGGLPKGGGHYKIGRPYKINGKWYTPKVDKTYDQSGVASWYGPGFHGKKTANGETFDQNALTAAHPTLPLPSFAYVTNLENGRTVLVRINDRGPYKHSRILDASHRVAKELGFHHQGVGKVRVKYAGRAPLNGDDSRERTHLASMRR
ncbi:MAG: septal ring lytic transglycosylase RlpA family protein [Pseudomonadota bacterium]